MRQRQQSFLPRVSLEHGGRTRQGRRKIMRPFDPKRPVHLVLKSSLARGERSMLHPRRKARVDALVQEVAAKQGVRILRYVNVGNHLHVFLLTRSRARFRAFLRELPGAIAQLMTGARKGLPEKFWNQPPYTRIVNWGRQVRTLEQYFVKNLFDAAGLLTRRAKAAGLEVISVRGWAGPPG